MWVRWYGPFVESFRAWAVEEPSVRAALIVGSQARTDEPADEWSDLDVVIFHKDPKQLVDSAEWVDHFGKVVLSIVEPTAVLGSQERRVLYSDGKDVDFAVFPSAALPFVAQSPEGLAVLGRGYAVLLDKDAVVPKPTDLLGPRGHRSLEPPNEAEFQATVADFWYHIQWAAKKLARGELWTAKMGCDGSLKLLLLRMIEWQTVLRSGGRTDVWHRGRFIDQWAEPEVRSRLPGTFARYDRSDLARGFEETGRLFSDLAREVATGHQWTYPEEAESTVLALVSRTLGEDRGTT